MYEHTRACMLVNQLKVWDTHRKTSIAPGNERVKKSSLILEFKGHQYGVQCCAITPAEDLVMSADIDSCVMVRGLYCNSFCTFVVHCVNTCTCTYDIHVHGHVLCYWPTKPRHIQYTV